MLDRRQEEYEARLMATKMMLRRYYNECVGIMAQEQGKEVDMPEALKLIAEIDGRYSLEIVDTLAPKKTIIQL